MPAAIDPSAPPSVLVLGREQADRARLAGILAEAAFAVSEVASLAEAESLMATTRFDLVVVDDDGAPGLWRDLATRGSAPILLLADSAGVIERIVALELGVDAVLPKPVHHREMLSTGKALIRRTRRAIGAVERPAGARSVWKLDAELRRFTGPNGKTASLSPSELALLKLFLDRPGAAVNAERAAGIIDDTATTARANFRVTLARLRRRLEHAGYPGDAIRTVRGVGYVFLPDEVDGAGTTKRHEPARAPDPRAIRALH